MDKTPAYSIFLGLLIGAIFGIAIGALYGDLRMACKSGPWQVCSHGFLPACLCETKRKRVFTAACDLTVNSLQHLSV